MLATPLRFLTLAPAELSLAIVLKSGQSFRWEKFPTVHVTREDITASGSSSSSRAGVDDVEWASGFKDRTIVLRQSPQGIYYRSLHATASTLLADLRSNTTLDLINEYFNLHIPLGPLYATWSRDSVFRTKVQGGQLDGIRVLKQDPWETLISFICSANNNIPRITQMVNAVCKELGTPLPHPLLFDPFLPLPSLESLSLPSPPRRSSKKSAVLSYYSFPRPSTLTDDETDPLLRRLGFGYRAPYIQATAIYLESKTSKGFTTDDYLKSLSLLPIEEAREKLLEFKGVGPKVSMCIALFGLGFNAVIPVDTHIHQIAIRDYKFPTSVAKTLTPLVHAKIQDKFQKVFGPFSGWAQQILFYDDLKSTIKTNAATVTVAVVKVEVKVEEEDVKEVIKTPKKRKRGPALAQRISTAQYDQEAYGADEEEEKPVVQKKQKKSKFTKVKLEVMEDVNQSPLATRVVAV